MTSKNFILSLLTLLESLIRKGLIYLAIALCFFFFALGFITYILCKDEIKQVIKAYFKGFKKEVIKPIQKQIDKNERKK